MEKSLGLNFSFSEIRSFLEIIIGSLDNEKLVPSLKIFRLFVFEDVKH